MQITVVKKMVYCYSFQNFLKLPLEQFRTVKNISFALRTFRNFPKNMLEALGLFTPSVIFWNILEYLVVYNKTL